MSSPTSFQAWMSSMRIPQFLDAMLQDLDRTRPSSVSAISRSVVAFTDAFTKRWSHAVADDFKHFVANVGRIGLPRSTVIFFAVPTQEGETIELFPGGSKFRVTPHNVENFMALFSEFTKQLEQHQPYRYTDYLRLLPISPHHSLESDFSVILNLFDSEISKWVIDSAEWKLVGLRYCVPVNGVLVNIGSGKSEPVVHRDLPLYISLARAALGAAELPAASEEQENTSSTTAPETRRFSEQSNFYKNFDKYLRAIYLADKGENAQPLSAETFRELDVFYCIPVMGKIIDLIPNGHNIPVPFSEKDNFCRLAAEKLGINLDEPLTESVNLKEAAAKQGLMSPKNYTFDLFSTKQKSDDRLGNSITKNLKPDELRFHFQMIVRQLAMGKWKAEDITGLNLYFEVPISGRLVPLVPDGDRIPVTLENKDDFVNRALDALQATKEGGSPPVPLPKKDVEEAKVLELFSPSHFEADIFAPYVPSNTVQITTVPPVNEEINSMEQQFWNTIEMLGTSTPSNLETLNFKFVLKFPNGRIVELKQGGHAMKVTAENLQEFIDTVFSKREAIHLAFRYSHEDLDPILHFPMEKAVEINVDQLTLRDLEECPLFELIDGLAGDEFSDAEFERMKPMYCIPLSAVEGGKYDLVPEGRTIPVSSRHRADFLKRVMYERDRLRVKFGITPSASQGPGSSTTAGATVFPAGLTEVPQPASAAEDRDVSNGTPVGATNVMGSSSTGLRNRSITTIPLTKKQIELLREFREKVLLLRHMPSLDEEMWDELRLAWCIRCEDVVFDIIAEGATKLVHFSEKDDYFDKCIRKIDEILEDQRERESVAVPQAGVDEMGLFSPTHFEQDLFAPAQHITTRSNLTASVNVIPAPPMVPQNPAQASPSRVQNLQQAPEASSSTLNQTLAQFLQTHNCTGAFESLMKNEVQSVADLLELTESDISEMVTTVLPRRRLIAAIASLKN